MMSSVTVKDESTQTDHSGPIGGRKFYPRDLKMAVVRAVRSGGRAIDVASKYRLRNAQVVYSILAWSRHQGNHGLSVHSLAKYLRQCSPEEEEPAEPNPDWATTEASDNLRMLDRFKFGGEGLRVSPCQAAILKDLLETVEKKRKAKTLAQRRRKLRSINAKGRKDAKSL
jgi:hypothetical protein